MVVVLIIGILAAIAIPQYNKAVEKSRATEALMTLSMIYDSNQRWNMQNAPGTTLGASDIDELDITLNCDRLSTLSGGAPQCRMKNFTYSLGGTGGGAPPVWYYLTACSNKIVTGNSCPYLFFNINAGKDPRCCWQKPEYEELCRSMGFTISANYGTSVCNKR